MTQPTTPEEVVTTHRRTIIAWKGQGTPRVLMRCKRTYPYGEPLEHLYAA